MRLSAATLTQAEAALPNYERRDVTPGVLHFGVGNFHRAHQAVYLDDLLQHDPSWGIVGVSLQRPDMSNALRPQNGLFSVTTRSAREDRTRIVGSLLDVLVACDEAQQVRDRLVDPRTRLVTLTVTEKAYCLPADGGSLDLTHPGIAHDLAQAGHPKTIHGWLCLGLKERRAHGVHPFTIMSCDNLANNGPKLRQALLTFAGICDPSLAEWIAETVAFPASMVDRIVPGIADEDRTRIARSIGLKDAAPVLTEPFCQWVIEDHFCNDRPPLELVGATLVDDVMPYETMKLRMLNGAHSTLAYGGLLCGHHTVDQAIHDPDLRSLVAALWRDELGTTLTQDRATLEQYETALLERFSNPALPHRLSQIAMDGSVKIRHRLMPAVRERAGQGLASPITARAIGAWIAFLWQSGGRVQDPNCDEITRLFAQNGTPEGFCYAVLEHLQASETVNSDWARSVSGAVDSWLASAVDFPSRPEF